MESAGHRFGIGRVISDGEDSVHVASSGMEQIEKWCSKRIDADHLQVVKGADVPTVSFMAMIVSDNLSEMSNPQTSSVRDYLAISRPTYNHWKALVHKGMSVQPKA